MRRQFWCLRAEEQRIKYKNQEEGNLSFLHEL